MKTTIRASFLLLVLLHSSQLLAQIPTGSLFWLRADKGIVATGSLVSSWSSSDATTFKAIQPTSAAQPTLVDKAINGQPAVRFQGSQYMICSSVYPVSKSYTLFCVVQLSNLGATNNIISGNSHAVYFNPPRLLHGDFNTQSVSSTSLTSAPALVSVRYRESSRYATVSVNGSVEDSAFVGTNVDLSLFLGAYQAANFMVGDLAETLLYDRLLTEADQRKAEDYLLSRYGITRVKIPAIDSTFQTIPQQLQFFARDENNGADVEIKGTIRESGFDSIRVNWFRDKLLVHTQALPLVYTSAGAAFACTERIQSELREYRLEVHLLRPSFDSVIAVRDQLVCGDVYLISGQSNTVMSGNNNQNEFVRTYGVNYSLNKKDTLWSLATASQSGGGSTVGAWGLRLGELIVMNQQVPVCIINGGVGGTTIEQNSRVDAQPDGLSSIYGSLLYRVKKSAFNSKAKAMFWYQGESNTVTNYAQNFRKLYSDWFKDYPSLQKIYVVQIRPGCAGFAGHDQLREVQRRLQDSLPKLEVMAAVALPGHDGCHYTAIGYSVLADNMFRLVNRDFYHSSDTIAISSPTLQRAFFSSSDHRELIMMFKPANSLIAIQPDTIAAGNTQSLKDYIYLSDSVAVQSIRAHGDSLILQLKSSSKATSVSYTPAVYYNGTQTIYEGPWLVNQRGIGALTFANVPIQPKPISERPDESSKMIKRPVHINPNPAADEVRVQCSLDPSNIRSIIISDMQGRESRIAQWKIMGAEVVIATTQFTSGHYLLTMSDEHGSVTGEFAIVR